MNLIKNKKLTKSIIEIAKKIIRNRREDRPVIKGNAEITLCFKTLILPNELVTIKTTKNIPISIKKVLSNRTFILINDFSSIVKLKIGIENIIAKIAIKIGAVKFVPNCSNKFKIKPSLVKI